MGADAKIFNYRLMQKIFTAAALWLLGSQLLPAQLQIAGAMRNTMFNGQLAGLVSTDTLGNNLYGLGPLAYLAGEVLIWQDTVFVSSVQTDGRMVVERPAAASLPFAGYASIDGWEEQPLPAGLSDLAALDSFLTVTYGAEGQPIFFRMEGLFDSGSIHIVNLPPGATVRNPEEAHRGKTNYPFLSLEADLLVFFSTRHRSVLTHHDTYIHLHLLSKDRQWMGHVDALTWTKPVRLFRGKVL